MRDAILPPAAPSSFSSSLVFKMKVRGEVNKIKICRLNILYSVKRLLVLRRVERKLTSAFIFVIFRRIYCLFRVQFRSLRRQIPYINLYVFNISTRSHTKYFLPYFNFHIKLYQRRKRLRWMKVCLTFKILIIYSRRYKIAILILVVIDSDVLKATDKPF